MADNTYYVRISHEGLSLALRFPGIIKIIKGDKFYPITIQSFILVSLLQGQLHRKQYLVACISKFTLERSNKSNFKSGGGRATDAGHQAGQGYKTN